MSIAVPGTQRSQNSSSALRRANWALLQAMMIQIGVPSEISDELAAGAMFKIKGLEGNQQEGRSPASGCGSLI